mmetsp:Transcript_26411/g.83664  ORF Transcript_26411/g.83664 Transcript_26411/m.83664 type:complete len:219 (+) Transcript_26411:173-829(+)
MPRSPQRAYHRPTSTVAADCMIARRFVPQAESSPLPKPSFCERVMASARSAWLPAPLTPGRSTGSAPHMPRLLCTKPCHVTPRRMLRLPSVVYCRMESLLSRRGWMKAPLKVTAAPHEETQFRMSVSPHLRLFRSHSWDKSLVTLPSEHCMAVKMKTSFFSRGEAREPQKNWRKEKGLMSASSCVQLPSLALLASKSVSGITTALLMSCDALTAAMTL